LGDFKVVKKRWDGTSLSVKCCCFVQNYCERVTENCPVWRCS